MIHGSRLAVPLVALVLLLFAGCGSSQPGSSNGQPSGATATVTPAGGRIDPQARTIPAGRDCASVRARGLAGVVVEKAPPVPTVSAELTSGAIVVHWQLLAAPASCHPVGLLVTANSVDKLDNMALSPGNGGGIRINAMAGTVRLGLPVLDLPPYEARVSVFSDRGVRNEVTTVPVAGSGPACPPGEAQQCEASARRKAMRCERATIPRRECPAAIYGTERPPPIRPLPTVTRAGLERSVLEAVSRAAYADTTIGSVSCRPAWSCTVAWRGGDRRPVRVRYRLSAAGQRGCWFAARVSILNRLTDTGVRSAIDQRPDGSAGLSGCVSTP